MSIIKWASTGGKKDMKTKIFAIAALAVGLAGCSQADGKAEAPAPDVWGVADGTPADAATGISLPDGFKATVFADDVGTVRHITASNTGWVYGALYRKKEGMGAVALHDADGDGVAETREYFAADMQGTGIGIYDGHLYFATDTDVMRWPLPTGGAPKGDAVIIAGGFKKETQHAAKNFAFDGKGGLYVNFGAPSNACMKEMRTKGSPGMRPCPILEEDGGVWKFDAATPDQTQAKDGYRYATGIRNGVAMDWNPHAESLYLAMHGRDQFVSFFPDMYTEAQSAELPSEEFHKIADGSDLGWPYSYYDHLVGKRIVMPEYGGDGKTESTEGQMPLVGFPGHWAPNGMTFMTKGGFPEGFQKGAFIAFHGSWNRTPMPQQGYRVAYVPLNGAGEVAGDWVTFADGFAGPGLVMSPGDAVHRPLGLTEGPDGALYIGSLMSGGRLWKVTYEGE
jgi:glucose/arabinose dehydrogenase